MGQANENRYAIRLLEERKGFAALLCDGEILRIIPAFLVPKKPFPSHLPFEEAFAEWEHKRVKNYAVWLLARKSYHSQELRTLFIRKGIDREITERILDECQASNYLNDDAWVQSFLAKGSKKYGMRYLNAKLKAKGISCSFELHKNQEIERIKHLLRTRYKLKDRQKSIASLMRKGFSYESILQALNEA